MAQFNQNCENNPKTTVIATVAQSTRYSEYDSLSEIQNVNSEQFQLD